MSVKEVFSEYQQALWRRIDRAFAYLIITQYFFTLVLVKSSSSLSGEEIRSGASSWIILLCAGLISLPSLYCSFFKPGNKASRYVITITQICYSSLFIFLSGSHPELYFHIFVSLAIIATYRDWRLLMLALAVAVLSSIFFGIYLYHSGYQLTDDALLRGLEYGFWIFFEVIFLIFASVQTRREIYKIAKSKLELINARRHAENINISRTQFFSVISHELRTPLNGIIGFSDFLRESSNPEEQKEYINIIKQCSDILLKLINDLLDFSKIESGCLEIDSHVFKPQDIRNYFEKIFALECKKKNIDFFFEIDKEVPPELIGDSHRIRQVLSNLIWNAIKFTESGSVRVRLSKLQTQNNIYRWEVEDTGIGIKNDNLTKIFSPYTQEHSATARKYGGSGLGLAISKNLVELMGGHLNVESTLRKGTVFYFTIPLN
ncbi:MAG: sensor histidine kinase [Pseudobdellovibrionaceae bacterium]